MKRWLELLAMKAAHIFDWFRRLFSPTKPWQADRSMVLVNLFLGGFFEEWPSGFDVVNLAEENKYTAPLGRLQLDMGRPDLPPGMTPAELKWTTDLILAWLKEGRTVLVCCDAGQNRSALVVCAVVAVSMGLSAERARAFVGVKRNKHVLHEWQFDALKAFVTSLTAGGPRDI